MSDSKPAAESRESAAEPEESPTMTLAEVTEYIGATSTGSARKTLSRWGIAATGREPGRGGASLYDRAEIREAKAGRPGRGHRSDLKDKESSPDSSTSPHGEA
ncbi:hypothetical protein ACFZAV_42800 [Streptomyces sp. NPDC008343]|uniref:hypothetical protein n=1 Tax=Streptomyces sp. NPDC008343 TaxID=3364828 RepID=UPI0036E28521